MLLVLMVGDSPSSTPAIFDDAAYVMNKPVKNIDQHFAVIKNALLMDTTHYFTDIPNGRYNTWLTLESWK